MARVDLVVPVKRLHEAKSRLRGAADRGAGDADAHARLTLALAHDTVAAVRAARLVRRLLVVSADPTVASELARIGVQVVADGPEPGLNAAYEHGAALLRADDPTTPVGALQADLPALLPAELDEAITAFVAGGARRAFVADAEGTGTSLLLVAGGEPLEPRFGTGSAQAHVRGGAVALAGAWPGLRRDVDTSSDLSAATDLGLGEHTRTVLAVPTGPSSGPHP
jgi:2-phospho-L-lactate guanylyltransferase